MRIRTVIFILLFVTTVTAQNWNVFNKSYRYNYRFDDSQLISHVLFVDSVEQSGMDTVYYMNRIGVVTGNTLQIDQPQFLMKKIIKDVNWNVSLVGSEDLFIIPTCTLNQVWQFDNINHITATCVAVTTVNVFNTTDSIKTIVVNNADTIVLSKQYGILQFPQLYAQNKYYKLVGIERKEIYEISSLYGEKVPNAWDIYNYEVGDKFRTSEWYIYGGTSPHSGCLTSTAVILAKTTSSAGYVYFVDGQYRYADGNNQYYRYSCTMTSTVVSPLNAPVVTYSTFSTPDLRFDSQVANKMYPGMVVKVDYNAYNIVIFTIDQGRFYKYYGRSPCQNTFAPMPGGNAPQGFAPSSSTATLLTNTWDGSSFHFAEGLGQVSLKDFHFEYLREMCMISAVKNGIEYFSPWNDVGLIQHERSQDLLLFPNPANQQIYLSIENGKASLYDPFGKLIKYETLESKNILDISTIPNGLYFLEIQTDSFKHTQKLIIQH